MGRDRWGVSFLASKLIYNAKAGARTEVGPHELVSGFVALRIHRMQIVSPLHGTDNLRLRDRQRRRKGKTRAGYQGRDKATGYHGKGRFNQRHLGISVQSRHLGTGFILPT